MKLISKREYTGQRVVLDGRNFVECKFTNCTLVLEGSALFQMDRCSINDDCRFAVERDAKNALDALKLMLHGGGWLSQVADAVLNKTREAPRFINADANVQKVAK
ncbi:MAG: hypothetical protein AB7F79_09310 [Steroidobacteraceae bacterium]